MIFWDLGNVISWNFCVGGVRTRGFSSWSLEPAFHGCNASCPSWRPHPGYQQEFGSPTCSRPSPGLSTLSSPMAGDDTLRFASKALNLASMSPGVRGHCERLFHKRHLTVGHNACKTILTWKLCASETKSAEDTYDQLFPSCQQPLLCQARSQSDSILLTASLLTDLD